MAAIEIYNKPMFRYRNECFVVLIANAWELLIKAILSKNKRKIFYPKERGKPLRSLTFFDALKLGKPYFPREILFQPVFNNLEAIIEYRNNSAHFYNDEGFGVLIYGLAQTAVVNFRDIARDIFQIDIANEFNLSLLPLSFGVPPDPIQFLRREKAANSAAVSKYLEIISKKTRDLEIDNIDTGRFLTVFTISLQSSKKITGADISACVGLDPLDGNVISRSVDPNKTHPYSRGDILKKIGAEVNGLKFTANTFEAIASSENLKKNPRYCWRSEKGGSPHYSTDVITYIKALPKSRIESMLTARKTQIRKTKAITQL